jgi:hypothetical protein
LDWPRTIENGFKISFDVTLPKTNLNESCRGKYVSVDYFVEVVIKKGVFSSDIVGFKSFFVLFPPPENPPVGQPVTRIMDKKDMKPHSPVIDFKVRIDLASNVASFKKPPMGAITVLESKEPITAITVAYVRTEKIFGEKGTAISSLPSEVCRMQIAENDPPHNVEFPFMLEWVRILIGPDIETRQFAVSMGLKVRVVFANEGYATAVIPVKLWRDLRY